MLGMQKDSTYIKLYIFCTKWNIYLYGHFLFFQKNSNVIPDGNLSAYIIKDKGKFLF